MKEYSDGKGGSFKIDDLYETCPNPHSFFLTNPVKPKECLYCGWGKDIVKEDYDVDLVERAIQTFGPKNMGIGMGKDVVDEKELDKREYPDLFEVSETEAIGNTLKEEDEFYKKMIINKKEEEFYCCPKNCGKCVHHLYQKIYECLGLINCICNKEVEEEISLEKIYEIFQEEDYYAPRVEELINKWKKENE